MAYVVHFHVLLAATYVAGIVEEPGNEFGSPAERGSHDLLLDGGVLSLE
jgi:hypothetical protein